MIICNDNIIEIEKSNYYVYSQQKNLPIPSWDEQNFVFREKIPRDPGIRVSRLNPTGYEENTRSGKKLQTLRQIRRRI